MKTRTALAALTILSVALVAAGGYCMGVGLRIPGYVIGALGAGWLGILYSHLITHLGRD